MRNLSKAVAGFLVFHLSTGVVMAGAESGNGGDALVCVSNGKTEVTLYDYYEAVTFYEIPVQLGDLLRPPLEIAHDIIKRLESVDPARAERWHAEADRFMSQVQAFQGVLVDIPDSLAIGFPEGCSIEQIAVRNPRAEHNPLLKEFIIRMPLFDRMDNGQKAGVILHEIIFKDFVQRGKSLNSVNARNFHALLVGDRFREMTKGDYFRFMVQQLKSPRTEIVYNGVCTALAPTAALYDSGLPKKVSICSGEKIAYREIKGTAYRSGSYFCPKLIDVYSDQVDIDETTSQLWGPILIGPATIPLNGESILIWSATLVIHKDGSYQLCNIKKNPPR